MSRNSMAAAPDWSPTGPRRPAYWLCGWYDRAMTEWLRQHDVSIPPRFGPDPAEDAVKRQRGWRIGCGEEKGVANYQVTAKFAVVEEWNANPRDGRPCLVAAFYLSILGPHGEVTAAIPRGNLHRPWWVWKTPPPCKQIVLCSARQVRGKAVECCALPGSLHISLLLTLCHETATLSLACLARLGIPPLVCPSSQQQAPKQQRPQQQCPQGGIIQVQRERETTQLHLCVSSH